MALSDHPLRIALMISGAGVNGVAMHCLLLVRYLLSRGHRIMLMHRPNAWIARQPDVANAELFEASFSRGPRELIRAARAIESFDPDVLHTHMSSAHTYGMLARLFGRRPIVATAHSATLQLHWYFNNIVIATSPAAAEHHARVNHVPQHKLRMIPNFIDGGRFAPVAPDERGAARGLLGLTQDEFVIGAVGELGGRKRQIDLVLALKRVLAAHAQAKLVLVGGRDDPYAEKLIAVARREGIDERVILTGARSDVPHILAAFDALALASERETGPIAVLEGMARGLPVVAARVGMTPYFVTNDETGFLVAIGDVEAFADRLIALAGAPERGRQMGSAGRRRALEGYDIGVIAPRIEATLREAAAMTNTPPLGFVGDLMLRKKDTGTA